jgi:hypothetical protein
MGIALFSLSENIGGTPFEDLVSGTLLGLPVGEMLAGMFIVGRTFIE